MLLQSQTGQLFTCLHGSPINQDCEVQEVQPFWVDTSQVMQWLGIMACETSSWDSGWLQLALLLLGALVYQSDAAASGIARQSEL